MLENKNRKNRKNRISEIYLQKNTEIKIPNEKNS